MAAGIDKDQEFVGAIDCGTTSSRFYIFDEVANVVAFHQKEFEQIYPHPGWHEHEVAVYESSINECITGCVEKFEKLGYSRAQIKGVGITNQRETTLVWDGETGKPLNNAVAWPDSRNAELVLELKTKADFTSFQTGTGFVRGEDGIRGVTGLPISTYFSAAKYAWLLQNVPAVKEAKEKGTLRLGTVDTWLVNRFTGGAAFVTDVTNASRTLLMSLQTLEWEPTLLEFFDVPKSALAKIVSNSEIYGHFQHGHILAGVPICGLAGDQQAALVGNKCLSLGSAKQTYGTGCFMLYNTGADIVKSSHGLLTTVGYRAGPNSPVSYALEGSVAVGGSSITWLRDNLKLISSASEVGPLAEQVSDTGGVYFVTGFSGLFAPYWDMSATGMLIGLTAHTTNKHIARATLEATCFQTRAILDAMSKDAKMNKMGGELNADGSRAKHFSRDNFVLKVDGGMTASDIMMQIQADILGVNVERPTMRESTALGAALLAGAALKLFGWDLEKPATLDGVNKAGVTVFEPKTTADERHSKFDKWNRAVERSKGWKNELL